MNITSHCVVGLPWTLKDSLGDELDVLDEPVEFMVGGGDLLAVIEQSLQGQLPGARIELNIEPEDGFGDYDEQLVFLEARRAPCKKAGAVRATHCPRAATRTSPSRGSSR